MSDLNMPGNPDPASPEGNPATTEDRAREEIEAQGGDAGVIDGDDGEAGPGLGSVPVPPG